MIPVEKQLPYPGKTVLVLSEGHYYIGWMYADGLWDNDALRPLKGVTHWQYLPTDPNDKWSSEKRLEVIVKLAQLGMRRLQAPSLSILSDLYDIFERIQFVIVASEAYLNQPLNHTRIFKDVS